MDGPDSTSACYGRSMSLISPQKSLRREWRRVVHVIRYYELSKPVIESSSFGDSDPLHNSRDSMKQVVQDISRGRLQVATVPAPMVQRGELLIANRASLISAGTEKMAMDLASKSLLGKARERPDHVRRVLEKVR